MKKILKIIINFFKKLFGIKENSSDAQKPIEEPTSGDTIEPEIKPQEEVDCSKLIIYPSDGMGSVKKITFKAKYK